MRVWLVILVLCNALLAESNSINQKISQNKTTLEDKKKKEAQINAKLQELGDAINKQEKESKDLEQIILLSENNIAKNQKEYENKQTLIKNLTSNQESLFQTRKKIESEIINLILKDISFIILLNDFQPESIQDLITEESFKTLSNTTKSHLKDLSTKQSKTIATLQNLQNEITTLKNFIDTENKKRKELKELQNKQTILIANYQKEITKYNNELQKIAKERDAVQDILANLNILKNQEERRKKLEALAKEAELKQQEEARLAEAKRQKESKLVSSNTEDTINKNQILANKPKSATKPSTKEPIKSSDGFDVRQVANSYHDISTTKYKGAKTIAPLDNFSIEKRFGPYFDPVYKMKVFNESVTLTPKGDDKVKSVLDGKVVFAKDTPILKRVVIIEHKNNMHTIYAQLDKIAPTIKPGRTVKKGYTIGRVDNALKFEVTLKDKHIDPLELISAKNI
ncbi:murein hydrolase activator EnvC family protein [Helicobacter turcicus]|uniref:Peptidoglycan DD-metalloendopeptidase family protein n=1 Tax=Helicobacter turcicus TaxID=2867412 RepID=A0ABS7JKJ6_9HELI|nr:peptidoglycan DD-metalloendopeptidase family protein [Helicobacter turcicus]MBX7489917.1 peptidoglycan DD-metalloendopeptidase family protein [Helicobacter turcicus]MBX7544777.1 peptidoglycan DD-metalloendopeptidase family protein [Helicobacter turcicus]